MVVDANGHARDTMRQSGEEEQLLVFVASARQSLFIFRTKLSFCFLCFGRSGLAVAFRVVLNPGESAGRLFNARGVMGEGAPQGGF